jgi:pimeloyl-ACP methyl ester carboxylesterase
VRIPLVALLLLAGCSVEDHFFVRRAGADLPVWQQGDAAADTLVLVQHGSGASGKVYDYMPAFDELEERYAFVYWDQRGAGISQGSAAELSLEESVLDLELVVRAVRERYAPGRLVLLGHSLGGGISLSYLREPARADGVDGYVDVSGGRSLPESYEVTRGIMLEEGARLGDDELVAFYERTPEFPHDEPDRSTHLENVIRVSSELGFDFETSTAEMTAFIQGRAVADTFFGPMDALAYLENTAGFLARFDTGLVDLSPADVANIPVPAAVIAGRFDLSVPPLISERTFDAFAADRAPSHLAVLESSGHWPMWDEPEAFATEVAAFIDAL